MNNEMPRQVYDWPMNNREPSPHELARIYGDGFPGCVINPSTDARLFGDGLIETFSQACPHLAGMSKKADRQVVPLFLSLIELELAAGWKTPLYSDEKQPFGNCVSRGAQAAKATTNSVEILVNGEPETYERPAWEGTYRGRGHRGHGMDPAVAARIDTQQGFLWRRQYSFADLRVQNSGFGGATGYTSAVTAEMANHKVKKWIRPENGDEALDLLASGYACHSGQSCGFSSRPNAQGDHPVSGRWAHDMSTVGYDRSKTAWPVEVVFVANSWGEWNSQPSQWPDKWPKVPGMITARLSDWVDRFVEAGSMFFYSDVQGVPAKSLPDWGSKSYL